MNHGYIIEGELYFVTITVNGWIDLFIRPQYKHIIVDSLTYCQQHKGLKVYCWVLMSSHLHAILSADGKYTVADIIRDFKKFTSKRILTTLEQDTMESRRKWLLQFFSYCRQKDKKVVKYSLWQDGYYPEIINTQDFYRQKLNYIHNNPVKQEFVAKPEDYLYSSAIDYAGGKGLLDVEIMY